MSATEKILERVRRLLALSESSNVHEASAAASAAQRLMLEHRIAAAQLDGPGATADGFERESIDCGRRARPWSDIVLSALCAVNGCHVVRERNRGGSGFELLVIGRPEAISSVRYLYHYLVREVERLCAEASEDAGAPGLAWRNSFKLGAGDTIARRLRETRNALRSATLARLDVTERTVAEFYGRAKFSAPRATQVGDSQAFRAGQRRGEAVKLESTCALDRGDAGIFQR